MPAGGRRRIVGGAAARRRPHAGRPAASDRRAMDGRAGSGGREERTMNSLNNLIYRFCRAVVVGFCRLYFRVTVEGMENVPRRGSFVLAPVHRSNVDFAIAACT